MCVCAGGEVSKKRYREQARYRNRNSTHAQTPQEENTQWGRHRTNTKKDRGRNGRGRTEGERRREKRKTRLSLSHRFFSALRCMRPKRSPSQIDGGPSWKTLLPIFSWAYLSHLTLNLKSGERLCTMQTGGAATGQRFWLLYAVLLLTLVLVLVSVARHRSSPPVVAVHALSLSLS